MGIFGPGKEYCQQLYFRDDHAFTIRNKPIEDTRVVEKKSDTIISSWPMPYKVLKRFNGFKAIKPCMLLLSFGRDIILDPFGQLRDEEKPEKGKSLIKTYISDIATAVFYKHEQGKKMSTLEKMSTFVGSLMILLGVAIAIVVAT